MPPKHKDVTEESDNEESLNPHDNNLLIRIDERLKGLSLQVSEMKNNMDDKFVTKSEFEPIKKLSYGLISIILIAVFGAILTLVIKK